MIQTQDITLLPCLKGIEANKNWLFSGKASKNIDKPVKRSKMSLDVKYELGCDSGRHLAPARNLISGWKLDNHPHHHHHHHPYHHHFHHPFRYQQTKSSSSYSILTIVIIIKRPSHIHDTCADLSNLKRHLAAVSLSDLNIQMAIASLSFVHSVRGETK